MSVLLEYDEFLRKSKDGVIVDVRSPKEFIHGHIPDAVNIPLFTDEERAKVGTAYTHQGKAMAVHVGLKSIGPNLSKMLAAAEHASGGKDLYVYCWRGGMRSASMAWLFELVSIPVFRLKGGYKAYRNGFSYLLADKNFKFILLGGPTGCGKTEFLKILKDKGEQVIDLEGLANHKGSAFGGLGEDKQSTTEHFGNLLHQEFRTMNPERIIWLEAESKSIGRVFIPDALDDQMRRSPLIRMVLPTEVRIKRIKEDYGQFSKEDLIASFEKIGKRLGFDRLKKAIEALNTDRMEDAIQIALSYYDKGYAASLKSNWGASYYNLELDTDDPDVVIRALLDVKKEIENEKD